MNRQLCIQLNCVLLCLQAIQALMTIETKTQKQICLIVLWTGRVIMGSEEVFPLCAHPLFVLLLLRSCNETKFFATEVKFMHSCHLFLL